PKRTQQALRRLSLGRPHPSGRTGSSCPMLKGAPQGVVCPAFEDAFARPSLFIGSSFLTPSPPSPFAGLTSPPGIRVASNMTLLPTMPDYGLGKEKRPAT